MRRSRRLLAVALAAVCVGSVAGLAGVPGIGSAGGTATPSAAADPPCAGHVTEPAEGLTVVSVQGARFGEEGGKTAARVVAFGPHGEIEWVHRSGKEHGVVWSYDVDPLPNGNLFVTATHPGTTLLYELDTRTGERVWVEELNITDTHDADMLTEHLVVVANMRNYDEAAQRNDDRIFVYNRTTGAVVWEWRFAPHFPRSAGGNYTEDWTHVNDVDPVGDDQFLVSPRNLDQVLLVNRTTGDIDLRLGSDNQYAVLRKQHNPDYLESADGDPTFLVADSENDRVVEYEHTGEGWRRTWSVGDESVFAWPRDADRLPSGNTLVADSRHNRVVELTPDGEVVWEAYAPWLVYDVERLPGDGSRGPTMRDLDATGSPALRNASPPSTATLERCDRALDEHEGGFGTDRGAPNGATPTPLPEWPWEGDGTPAAGRGEDSGTPTDRVETVPDTEAGGAGFGAVVAGVAIAIAALLARRREDL